jgi:RHS repeat-associated protein
VFDLRFPGQRYDAATGLYYNYFRDYDATSGRYIQVDPIGLAGGINPYLYANGSPLRYTDPSGEFAFVGAVIGAAVEAAVQAYDNYSNGCDLLDYHNYSFTNIGIAAAGGAFAPGWLSVGKKAFTSGKAISKLASQFRRSQTVNRLVKIDSRIVAHEEAIKDLLVPQLGIQATSAVFKKIYGAGGDACGCRQ